MIAALHAGVKGGRAVGRALTNLFLIGLCILGVWLMVSAAVIPVKAWVAQILLDRAFEQSIAQGTRIKPWPWADMAPVARITVPRLGVSDIVLSGGSGQAMAFGPTMLAAREPVTVMAAHRDTHFAFLQHLRRGDRVVVRSVAGELRTYTVTGTQVVHWDRFAYPADPADRVLALTTCYPFGATVRGPLRYVVWARMDADDPR